MMRLAGVVVVSLALWSLTAVAASADKRVALVIGNSAYVHAPPLANPRNDAADMAAKLKELGFEVVVGLDLDKAGMERRIRQFAESMADARMALFFYAGHGLQVAGKNYLVPTDAALETVPSLDFEATPFDFIQQQMERHPSVNVYILDACRNNPLGRSLARAMGTRSAAIKPGLAKIQAGRQDTIISFSTQPDNVALDGTGRNSPFSATLLKHLAAPDKDMAAVFVAVRKDVLAATDGGQVPWENSSLTGQFFFKQRDFAAPGAMEPYTDRPGYDIEDAQRAAGSAEACRDACYTDIRCRAWTHVRPGILGPEPRCFLKNAIPPAQANSCCTSGVKGVAPRR